MSLPLEKLTVNARATSTPITFGDSDNGNVQIAVEFEIVDHEHYTGETITYIGHFTDATAARTIEALCHAGWTGDDVYALKGVTASEALAETVQLVCEPEEYKGDWKLKVRWVNKLGAGRFKFKAETSDDKLRALGAQMRATVKSVRASGGAPRKPAAGGGGSGQQHTPTQPHPNAPGSSTPPRDDIPC
jgi:hypothetical protein